MWHMGRCWLYNDELQSNVPEKSIKLLCPRNSASVTAPKDKLLAELINTSDSWLFYIQAVAPNLDFYAERLV